MQKLTIHGIESKQTKTGNTKTVLVCEEGKFYFYRKTKTGTSKAQEQFNKFDFKIGDTIEAEVQTEDKTFTNPAGKSITYKDNWVKFFGEVGNTPTGQMSEAPQEQENTPQNVLRPELDAITVIDKINALNARIDKMAEWAKGIEKWAKLTDQEIIGLKDLATDLRGPKAVDFHLPEKKFQFDLGKVKDTLQAPENSGVQIQIPEGLVDKNF